MSKHQRVLAGALLGLAVAAVAVDQLSRSPAHDKGSPAAGQRESQPDSPEMAAVRKLAEKFMEAFNRGDARALASFWTDDGEYIDPDGDTIRGRAAIEKDYVAFFKQNPK